IYIVHNLMHERPAAIERARAAPAAAIVILLRAPPLPGRFAEREPAETTRVHRPLEFDVGVAEARRENRAQLNSVALTGLDDPIAALRRDFERLFDDDVLAGIRRGHGGIQMLP